MTDFARPARRTFMCASAAIGSAALLTACGNGESAVETPEAKSIPEPSGEGQVLMPVSDLPVGSRASAPATYPDGSATAVMVFRPDEKTVLAYSNKCTHQGCALTPKSQDENFYCACHGSKFAPKDGTVVAGPAKAALPRYAAEIKDKNIVVYVTADA
ncbi:Rieske (2Fe-2S) protein [Glutamicibacter protophormiae]|uniref:Cytochrome bc1 complex Rieske iron-sulfur subunit n=1 Tax=Glutamicibacter protophormiae TaxID=37930 RepID=A0ABS4XUV0_GLUPR|nr:Rieske (2Fe-2S) protein [Glutamicibacter protophormiae]MBP2400032.1 Rieske Fe-S protein [Glutamicibacter protophormiae]GGL75816.1 iron-sulfur protein [Glutamicibacter protophormiae]